MQYTADRAHMQDEREDITYVVGAVGLATPAGGGSGEVQ